MRIGTPYFETASAATACYGVGVPAIVARNIAIKEGRIYVGVRPEPQNEGDRVVLSVGRYWIEVTP